MINNCNFTIIFSSYPVELFGTFLLDKTTFKIALKNTPIMNSNNQDNNGHT